MPDLSFRFDEHTEKFDAWHLKRIRAFARQTTLPQNLVVEIGANRGRFLTSLALRQPHRFHLGIEWRKKYVDLSRETLKEKGVDNAEFLQADANIAFPIVLDDAQVGDLFILFPDPWWKLRHRKRRIIQPHFLDLAAQKMRDHGRLWIRTDVGPLADDMQQILDAHPSFVPLQQDELPSVAFPRTTRERTIIKKGLPIHLLYYRRVSRVSG